MMALRWFLSSAFTQVLGPVGNERLKQKGILGSSEEEGVKKLKDPMKEGISRARVSIEQHPYGFEMPLHYPRYTKEEYQNMKEWKVDLVLQEYGFRVDGTLDEKRWFAIGTFVWPNQL